MRNTQHTKSSDAIHKLLANPENDLDFKFKELLHFCRLNYGNIKTCTQLIRVYENKTTNSEDWPTTTTPFNIYKAFEYWYANSHQLALNIVNEDLQVLISNKFYFEYALALKIKCLISWSKGNLESAFEAIFAGLKHLKNLNVKGSSIAKLHISIAFIYYDLSELKTSSYHFKKCQESLHECSVMYDYSMDIYSLIGLASIGVEKGQHEESAELLDKALQLSIKYKIWMTEARIYFEQGIINKNLQRTEAADCLFKKSLEIRQKNNSIPAVTSCLIALGELHLQKRADTAKKYLEQALENCIKNKLLPKQIKVYELLALIYEKEGDFEKAYACLKLKNEMYLKTYDLAKNNKTKYLQYQFKTKQAEKEANEQRQTIEKLQKANQTITKQKNAIQKKNKAILQKNLEKDVLLKEIHHRVKNNLQIITSFLGLQSFNISDHNTLEMYRSSQNRINSMAIIHEMLYQSDDLSRINYQNYIKELLKTLILSLKISKESIHTDIEISNLQLNLDTAIPLGLIITEIITNSLKYAFNDEDDARIYIKIKAKNNDKYYQLEIGDNGIGFVEKQQKTATNSLGTQLIYRLTKQLFGTVKKDNSKKGTHYIIHFKAVENKPLT